MVHPDSDLAEFELERILALSDLVISYSYRDDSTIAKPAPLKAFIADNELWITFSPENLLISLWKEENSGNDQTPLIITTYQTVLV